MAQNSAPAVTIDRACEHRWFGAWDWLVNAALRATGVPIVEVGPRETAVDLHVHTLASRCSISTPDRIILKAAALGLGGVGVLDHNDPRGTEEAERCAEDLKRRGLIPEDFLVIPGLEVTTSAGHMGALFVRERFEGRRTPAEAVRTIHEMGGLAVAVHPYHSAGIGDVLFDIPIDAVETHCASVFSPRQREKTAALLTDPRLASVAKLGSSDAHYVNGIGSCYSVLTLDTPSLESARLAILNGGVRPRESRQYLRLQRILGAVSRLH